jgi:putative ABC transport system permease protein
MAFWISVKVALRGLLANALRSFLTMLGVIIGVGAVIAMLALGEGAKIQITEQIRSFGTNLLVIRPGLRGVRGVRGSMVQNLTLDDAEAIRTQIPGVEFVAPEVAGSRQVKYLNANTATNIVGTTPEYFSVRNFTLAAGRSFTAQDVRGRRKVCVLGSKVVEELFHGENPLGKYIKIAGINFYVLGSTQSKGDQGWYNPDNQVFIPISTAMKRLFGVDHLRAINIQVVSIAAMENTNRLLEDMLRKRHRLRPGAASDFYIRSQGEYLESMQSVSNTFTFLLGGVASVSLLVGGIGIMNIMLVTVTERTREIGIRKALGGKRWDILKQFLIESVVLSVLGGSLGVELGVGAAYLITRSGTFHTVVTPQAVALAFLFSVGIGIFFGFYPARKAAALDPVEALRYE